MRTLACFMGVLMAACAMRARAQAPPVGITVIGRVLDPAPAPPDGVACCEVTIELVGMGRPGYAHVDNRADGSFRAELSCVESGLPTTLAVEAACCGLSHVETIDACLDPMGLPRIVDVGDLTCPNAPRAWGSRLMGTVLCRAGALLEPVADCTVYGPDESGFAMGFLTRTDVNGDWEGCVPCIGRVTHVQFQCCGEVREVDLAGCPERIAVPAVVCDPCPVPPCGGAFDTEISGRVTCDADGDGSAEPVPGCDVRVSFPYSCAIDAPPRTVTTDQDGVYRTCAPCEADPADCWGWQILAEAGCCTGAVLSSQMGCPFELAMPDLACVPAPGGACVASGPCAALETIVSGIVTCDDPGGPVPAAGCLVSVTPFGCGGAAVNVTTDAAGAYSACVPCVGCAQVRVLAWCCGTEVIRDLACGVETRADITCVGCAPPAPCPPQETIVRGVVTCPGPSGPEPAVGCLLSLEPVGCGGAPVAVTTDAAGAYAACVPCDGCPQVAIVTGCCGAAAIRDLACGVETQADIACGACAQPPCPQRETRVSGVVTCDGPSGPEAVAGCVVRVSPVACGGAPVVVTTDADGRLQRVRRMRRLLASQRSRRVLRRAGDARPLLWRRDARRHLVRGMRRAAALRGARRDPRRWRRAVRSGRQRVTPRALPRDPQLLRRRWPAHRRADRRDDRRRRPLRDVRAVQRGARARRGDGLVLRPLAGDRCDELPRHAEPPADDLSRLRALSGRIHEGAGPRPLPRRWRRPGLRRAPLRPALRRTGVAHRRAGRSARQLPRLRALPVRGHDATRDLDLLPGDARRQRRSLRPHHSHPHADLPRALPLIGPRPDTSKPGALLPESASLRRRCGSGPGLAGARRGGEPAAEEAAFDHRDARRDDVAADAAREPQLDLVLDDDVAVDAAVNGHRMRVDVAADAAALPDLDGALDVEVAVEHAHHPQRLGRLHVARHAQSGTHDGTGGIGLSGGHLACLLLRQRYHADRIATRAARGLLTPLRKAARALRRATRSGPESQPNAHGEASVGDLGL